MPSYNKNYYPTQAQITANEDRINTGILQEGYGVDGNNLFTSGFSEGFMETAVIMKYFNELGMHFLHTYLRAFGQSRSMAVYGTEHAWLEQDRIIKGLTVSSVVSGDTTPSLVIAATSTTDTRYRVNDILQTDRLGVFTMVVTAVDEVSSPPQYTVQKRDGSNWAAATEMVAGDLLGYLGNASWAEGTGQPDSLTYNPAIKTNKLTIIKETDKATGSAITTKTEISVPNGGSVYANINRLLMLKRLMYARESQYMFAEETADGSAYPSGRGIYQDIYNNATATTDYGATLTEADFQNQILAFKAENASTYWLGLCGMNATGGAQTALTDYVVDGAQNFGSFGINSDAAVGLNIRQYHYNGVTLEFHNYRGFDERNATGYSGGAAATTNDFRNFILLLNMGENAGTTVTGGSAAGLSGSAGYQVDGSAVSVPYLSHVYRALGSVDRSLVIGTRRGMSGLTNSVGGGNFGGPDTLNVGSYVDRHVGTDLDQDEFFALCEVGVRMPCVDVAHGYMRKSA